MPPSPPPRRTKEQIIAARVRAAIAYTDLQQDEIVERTGLSVGTLRRIRLKESPRGATVPELHRLADACDVPRTWLTDGKWDDSEGARSSPARDLGRGTDRERLDVIEHHLAALLDLEDQRAASLPQTRRRRSRPNGKSTA
jgi:transcriptional regulator with XRE-family HTH domain